MKIKQINNLTIRCTGAYHPYQVVSPDKRVLEEFMNYFDAVKCAEGIKDFVVNKGRSN